MKCKKQRVCKYCNANFDGEENSCSACRTMKRRIMNKKKLVDYKGGKCCRCGYDTNIHALHFHHRNPEDKKIKVADELHSRSIEKLFEEVDKCDLLCANCHIIEHLNKDRRKFII